MKLNIFFALFVAGLIATTANAGPWVKQGSSELRSDIQILADAGIIGGAYFDRNDCVSCRVIPYDGEDHGLAIASSDCVPVVNSPPDVIDVYMTPLSGPKNAAFTCNVTWIDPDPTDQMPGTVTVQRTFYVNYPVPDDPSQVVTIPVLDMIADGRFDVDFMVTHRFGLDQCKDAFDLVHEVCSKSIDE